MAGVQQLLFSVGSSAIGETFLEELRSIQVTASSSAQFEASTSLFITFRPNGVVSYETFASGDFTNQVGAGSYSWLEGGSSSNYVLRYTTSPSNVPALFGPGQATWTPINDGINLSINRRALGISSNEISEANFFIIFELALASNPSNVLSQGQVNVLLRAISFSDNSDGDIDIF